MSSCDVGIPVLGRLGPSVRNRGASAEQRRDGVLFIPFLFALTAVVLGWAQPAAGQVTFLPSAPFGAPSQNPPPKQDPKMPMQHPMPEHQTMQMTGALGISFARDGSGTSWLPDETPMLAIHRMAGTWTTMLHFNAFVQHIHERTSRGDAQFGSINWVMGMARRPVGKGSITLRGMFSLEPLTVGKCGYPDVLATGEFCNGEPIHDRQHPHDLFMELGALYERELTDRTAIQLYGGPVGEPALGPTAYPHRPSAMSLILAPISHHWLDSTHISFGVVTAAVFQKTWKVEVSAFNGREPDEERYNFDIAPLDSFSARFSYLPTRNWAFQFSGGQLTEAEPAHAGEPPKDVRRLTASGIYHRPLARNGTWATTIAWGQNREEGISSHAFLLETNIGVADRDSVFGRFEVAQKSADDLVVPLATPDLFVLRKVQAGYERTLPTFRSLVPGVGASVSLNFTPSGLRPFYGDNPGAGFAVFVTLRPKRMEMMSHGMSMGTGIAPVANRRR